MVTSTRAAGLAASGLNVSQGANGTTVGAAPSTSKPASPTSTSGNTSPAIGSTAETNALLGGNYFDTTTGAPTKPFTASDAQANVANYQTTPAVVTSDAAQNHLSQINDFHSTVKQGMATQSANNTSAAQAPNIPGYAVTTGGTKPTNSGTFSFDVAGKTYYATPNGTQTTQSDLQKALAAYGATNDSDAPTASTTPAAPATPSSQLATENTNYQNQTAQVMSDTEQAYQTYKSAVAQITSGVFPLSPSQQALVDSTNNAFNAMLGDASLKAAAISSETGGFSNKVTSMLGVMSNIESQQAAAIAKLDQGFQDENYKLIKDSYDEFTSLEDKKTAQLDSLHKDAVDQLNTAITTQQKVQDNIDTIAEDAAKNGADAKTIAAIRGSADVGSAIGNAGDYLQTGTGQQADYLWYKRNAQANGQVPQDYAMWKAADDAQTAKTKASEAYATAFATQAGKNAATTKYAASDPTSPVTASTGVMSGVTVNAPASIAPYVAFANNGVKYVDMSSFKGTPTEANAAIAAAQSAGYKVITNKNTALDVQNITDAMGKLADMQTTFDKIGSDGPAQRALYQAAFTKMANALQTNPDVVGSNIYQDTALDILKAMSGVQGFRGGQSMVQQVKDTLPNATDTKAAADAKIATIKKLIEDRETALVGKPSASDQALIDANNADQTVSTGISKVKATNPSLYNAASAMYTQIDQSTGQPYTASDILATFPQLAQ